jgi:hypothetical protein
VSYEIRRCLCLHAELSFAEGELSAGNGVPSKVRNRNMFSLPPTGAQWLHGLMQDPFRLWSRHWHTLHNSCGRSLSN